MDQAKKVRKMYRRRVERDIDTWAAGEVAKIGRRASVTMWIQITEGIILLGVIAYLVVTAL